MTEPQARLIAIACGLVVFAGIFLGWLLFAKPTPPQKPKDRPRGPRPLLMLAPVDLAANQGDQALAWLGLFFILIVAVLVVAAVVRLLLRLGCQHDSTYLERRPIEGVGDVQHLVCNDCGHVEVAMDRTAEEHRLSLAAGAVRPSRALPTHPKAPRVVNGFPRRGQQ